MKYNYAVFADISCDLTSELRTRFEVDGYLKGYFSSPESAEVEGRLDLSEAELDEFWSSLKVNKNKYQTSALSVDQIVLYFESFLQQGKDILALSLSSSLSATYNMMVNAQKIVCEKYPQRKVIIVDSRRYSAALGLLTIKACENRSMGYSIEKNAETLEKIKNTIHQMGSLDDFFWLASRGRISNSKAFFGTLANMKVMGDFGPDGMVTPIAKVIGYKRAYKTTVEYIKKTIKSANEQIVIVAHSARKEQAQILAAMIKEQIKPKELIICALQHLTSINTGPGLLCAYYFGTEITDLKHEKEIINEITASSL